MTVSNNLNSNLSSLFPYPASNVTSIQQTASGAQKKSLPSKLYWESGKYAAYRSLYSPFVQSMAKGTLSIPNYRSYLRCCYTYLVAYGEIHVSALHMAQAWHDDDDKKNWLVGSIEMLYEGVAKEVKLLEKMCSHKGIDVFDSSTLTQAAINYCKFLKEASLKPLPVLMAAIIPCCRLYDWLSRHLAMAYEEATSPTNPYNYWIVNCLTPQYEIVPVLMEQIMDSLILPENFDEAKSFFLQALTCEYEFFDSHILTSETRLGYERIQSLSVHLTNGSLLDDDCRISLLTFLNREAVRKWDESGKKEAEHEYRGKQKSFLKEKEDKYSISSSLSQPLLLRLFVDAKMEEGHKWREEILETATKAGAFCEIVQLRTEEEGEVERQMMGEGEKRVNGRSAWIGEYPKNTPKNVKVDLGIYSLNSCHDYYPLKSSAEVVASDNLVRNHKGDDNIVDGCDNDPNECEGNKNVNVKGDQVFLINCSPLSSAPYNSANVLPSSLKSSPPNLTTTTSPTLALSNDLKRNNIFYFATGGWSEIRAFLPYI